MKKTPPKQKSIRQREEEPFSFQALEEIPPLHWSPIKRHVPVAEWPLFIQHALVRPLDMHFCPALFVDYPQDIWREQFIRPVVLTLTPVVIDAVIARRGKGTGDAIERAVYRALRWIQERMNEEFLHHPDDTLEERCKRWLRAIHTLTALPTYARKKDTWPDLVLTLRYEAIRQWCQAASERKRIGGVLRWMLKEHRPPRPTWWLPAVDVEAADWSSPHLAARGILEQMCGLSSERINALVKKARRSILRPAVRDWLNRPRPPRSARFF